MEVSTAQQGWSRRTGVHGGLVDVEIVKECREAGSWETKASLWSAWFDQ